MKKIILRGGNPLFGKVAVSGSKNAALPIIFACILTKGVSEIRNLPDIGDVRVALDLLRSFGAVIYREDGVTYIDTENLRYVTPDNNLVSKIRASTYLLGSCLSRFGRCHILPFGGCNFASRPIDMHIDASVKLGARIIGDEIVAEKLMGGEIKFCKASVGATVNAILLASSAHGLSLIRGGAREPHIDALIDFLVSCGASIERIGEDLHIQGRALHGGKITVIGDMIEAGSYIAAGLITDGAVSVTNCPIGDMGAIFSALDDLGAHIEINAEGVCVTRFEKTDFLSVVASPYPGFPTDLQPIVASLMAAFSGGEIIDTVWPTRFGYLKALSDFGVGYKAIGNRAVINASKIKNGTTAAPDLRGGMACLLAALSAEGESEILSGETIFRGYENLENKLCTLGANIIIKES